LEGPKKKGRRSPRGPFKKEKIERKDRYQGRKKTQFCRRRGRDPGGKRKVSRRISEEGCPRKGNDFVEENYSSRKKREERGKPVARKKESLQAGTGKEKGRVILYKEAKGGQ